MLVNNSVNLLDSGLVEQVAKIVSAYVSNNPVSPADLPTLIANTHSTMRALSAAQSDAPVELPSPAVSIKKSVMPDFIVCLEDGKKFKSMKRHLAGLGMTPDDYRIKWGLPSDYPMVAPNYSAARSLLAKNAGLGRKPAVETVRAKKTGKSGAAV